MEKRRVQAQGVQAGVKTICVCRRFLKTKFDAFLKTNTEKTPS